MAMATTSSVPRHLPLHSHGFSANPRSQPRLPPCLLGNIPSQALSANAQGAITIASSSSSKTRTAMPIPTDPLPRPSPKIKRFAHLSHLLPQLASADSSREGSVSSILLPFVGSLNGEDWNFLVSEVGLKSWQNSFEVFRIFAEEEKKKEEKGNRNDEGECSKGGNAPTALKIYTSLIRVLSKNGRNEEVKVIMEKMRKEEIAMDATFFNALFRSFSERGEIAEISQGFLQMEALGIKPDRLSYEMLISACLHEESVGIEKPVKILEDMIRNGLSVSANTFRDLISGFWRLQDLEGAEKVFGLMQAAGHQPELKVVLKLMQLNGNKGNHQRNFELFKLLKESGVKQLDAAYVYRLHACCKAGLLKQSQESFNKFQSVTGKKPPLVAFNMMIDAFGKQGLHEEALQYYVRLCDSGLQPNAVSYCSIISAMVKAGKFKKAEHIYNKMLAKGVKPNLHVYATMIHCYTKCKLTARGHELYLLMKKSKILMSDTAYGSVLALYIGGEWYEHAADVLKDLEAQGFNLDIPSHGLLIRTFAKRDDKMDALQKAVQTSKFSVCKVLSRLAEEESSNHNHLSPKLYDKVIGFLDGWKDEDKARTSLSQLYNAFLDYFWQRGLTGTSKKLLEKARKVYALKTRPQKNSKGWTLDVRGLSVGGAAVAVFDWLVDAADSLVLPSDSSDPRGLNMVIITGGSDGCETAELQISSSLKRTLLGLLKAYESPFIESAENPKEIHAVASDVIKWVSENTFKNQLGFTA